MKFLSRYQIDIEIDCLGVEPKTEEIETSILLKLASFEIKRKGSPIKASAVSVEYLPPFGLLSLNK